MYSFIGHKIYASYTYELPPPSPTGRYRRRTTHACELTLSKQGSEEKQREYEVVEGNSEAVNTEKRELSPKQKLEASNAVEEIALARERARTEEETQARIL